jgi:hypothetical protein
MSAAQERLGQHNLPEEIVLPMMEQRPLSLHHCGLCWPREIPEQLAVACVED